MELTLTFTGLSSVRADMGRLRHILRTQNLVGPVAADARNIMVERTLAGKDVDHRPFKPYSRDPYYRSKNLRPVAKGGRKTRKDTGGRLKTVAYDGGYAQFAANTKASATPNLSASGEMLRAFQSRSISNTRALVSFIRKREAAKALGNAKKRRMVGIHKSEERRLQATFSRLVDGAVRRAGF